MSAKTEGKRKRPLGKSIVIGCTIFALLLSTVLGVASFLSFRNALYEQTRQNIADILNYVNRHIDDDDLEKCINTLHRSEKYNELEAFMDAIKEDFSIHYLYILKPVYYEGVWRIMSVVSAEDYYNRNVDTDGNLYLGWISDDEYDEETVIEINRLMTDRNINFMEENTDWGTDYTGALTLFNSKGVGYAHLAVDVDITEMKSLIRRRTLQTLLLIVALYLVFTVLFILWAHVNIIRPIVSLTDSAVSFADKSHGQRSVEALAFKAPKIHENNEVSKLSDAVTKMSHDMQDYVSDILSAERKADAMEKQANQMSELAVKDALTGIRNKAAYDREVKKLDWEISSGVLKEFGVGMIDLNFLKKINDTQGHDFGDVAIKTLSEIICGTFEHSPVFRIGGDEFVVILKGRDLINNESLVADFNAHLAERNVSAAIGIAFFDSVIDSGVLSVFKRADQLMYECKKEMKAERQ